MKRLYTKFIFTYILYFICGCKIFTNAVSFKPTHGLNQKTKLLISSSNKLLFVPTSTPTVSLTLPPSASSTCFTTLSASGCGTNSVRWYNDTKLFSTSNPLIVATTSPVGLKAACFDGSLGPFSNSVIAKPTTDLKILTSGTVDVCQTGSVLLTASTTASGLTYQWYRNGINQFNNNLNYNATSAGEYMVIASNGTCSFGSSPMDISAPLALSAATGTTSNVSNQFFTFDASCDVITKISPTNFMTGSVESKLFIETATITNPVNGQSGPFVRRHYQITPSINASFAEAKITLYFTQNDFDLFNTLSAALLPTSPTDNAGKANLRIMKISGSATDASGLVYPSGASITTINPEDYNIVYVNNRWEVTFSVVGFSGFFVNSTQTATPLPITLINFTAQNTEGGNFISWATSNEKNSSHFEIQKSDNALVFNTLAQISTGINSTEKRSYSYLDADAETGVNYYRLKLFDLDGKTEYSQIVVVNNEKGNKVKWFPNPSNNYLIVENELGTALAVSIYDSMGKLVYQSDRANAKKLKINTAMFASGNYVLQVLRDHNISNSKLIIKH